MSVIPLAYDRDLDPYRDFDWNNDFVWVQRVALLRMVDAREDRLRLQRVDGREITLSRAAVELGYYPVPGGMLKPRFDPVKGLRVNRPVTIRLGAERIDLAAGDVLVRSGKRIEVVAADDFMRDFEPVAYPNHRVQPEPLLRAVA
jgi:hypothetical protein